MVVELPPKPGQDGLPEPPPAPVWGKPNNRDLGSTPPKNIPDPPPGFGPVLYTYKESWASSIFQGIIATGVLFGFFCFCPVVV